MDLLRYLLLHEETDGKHKIPTHYTNEQRAYHLELLQDAGFVVAKVHRMNRGGQKVPDLARIERITMAGHDFLEVAKSDTVWNKAKQQISDEGVGWSVDILEEICTRISRSRHELD